MTQSPDGDRVPEPRRWPLRTSPLRGTPAAIAGIVGLVVIVLVILLIALAR